jgi:hypothetical protein
MKGAHFDDVETYDWATKQHSRKEIPTKFRNMGEWRNGDYFKGDML